MNVLGRRWTIKFAAAAILTAGLMGFASWTFAAVPATGNATVERYTVEVGAQSNKGNIQSYNFYPDVLTIDVGDTVTWVEAAGVHTVEFIGSGASTPPPGSPQSLSPAGGSTFDGSGFVSSGLLTPGQTYSLTFTQPGTYVYQCGIHPDMVGAVVVQPMGTPRPLTPAEALLASQFQRQVDLGSGDTAWDQARLTTTRGSQGTTVYHVLVDLPSPLSWTVPLADPATGTSIGNAELRFSPQGLTFHLQVFGLQPFTNYKADVLVGSSAVGSPMAFPLGSLTTNGAGQADVSTTENGVHSIPGNIWFIDVTSGQGAQVVASGQVDYPQYGSLRYLPGTIYIHAGDTVVWSEYDPHEAHTITFLAPGQTPQQADMELTKAVGGAIVHGPGFFNSGLLWVGSSYQLTFVKPGTYRYRCLLHDSEGMLGSIVVLPK